VFDRTTWRPFNTRRLRTDDLGKTGRAYISAVIAEEASFPYPWVLGLKL
jgi:hypothetical protein